MKQINALEIDRVMFEMAFGRDVDYHDVYPQSTWLDLRTGEVIWVYEDDDDALNVGLPPDENRSQCERIETEPEHYLEIPGLDHGDHHEILKRFLRSDWCDDEERMQRAYDAYTGSIGRWKYDVGDTEAVNAFYAFQDARIITLAEEFLQENGIIPKWK